MSVASFSRDVKPYVFEEPLCDRIAPNALYRYVARGRAESLVP